MKRSVFGLLFVLIITSCGSKEKTVKSPEKVKIDRNATFILKIQTSPCFGRCPFYELKVIGEDGTAIYNARRYPNTNGAVTKILPRLELDSIEMFLNTNKFWDLESEYDNPNVTDLPSTTITFTKGDRTKSVKGRHDVPEDFKRITAFIERLRLRNFGEFEKKR